MQRRRHQSGVTLVELALASVLVAVALVGAAGSVFSAALMEETATRKRNATRAVSALIADVRASDFDALVTDFGGSTHTVEDGGGQVATATVDIADATVSGSDWTVYRVQVDVEYANSDLDDALSFVTYVCDHRDSVGADAAPADVPTPDGVLLDWVTSTEEVFVAAAEPTSPTLDNSNLSAASLDDDSLESSDSDDHVASDSDDHVASTDPADDAKYALLMQLIGLDYE